ncbi:unnamed protein product [Schistosoma curassoni]|uniref:Kinase n=1 Tax=Schistosoma curassoni TaxID=6186 RepID=A0A183JEH7_9TREM|nr:unnamed protein product [Schistosoma curassoni]
MGRRTYAPDSSPSKIMIECAKYKWREEIGFLVTGLKVFYPDLNEYTTFDIFFGRSLNPSTIYDNDINRAKRLANQFVKKLTQLAKWFENQNCYHFYASSLLLAYDSVDANDEIMPSPNTTTTTTTTTTTQLPYSYYHHDHDHHHSCQDNNKESIISNIDNNEADEYVLVYLIDFTRWELVTDCSQIKDENFLYGLNYLIELFQRASLDSSPLT